MHEATRGLETVHVYMDDILVASSSEQEHAPHLRADFERLSQHGVPINIAKYEFGRSDITFIGHSVSSSGIRPLLDKVFAICDYPESQYFRQLRPFAGLVNFYHRFIPHCAETMQPLTDLLSKVKRKFVFPDTAQVAFASVKDAVAKTALLNHHDPLASISVVTDASDTAVGAVLQQFIDDSWQPSAFFSKRLQPAESRYNTFGRELLAIYLGIRRF
ncbi:unnamed protein product [Fasciola hepatica]|uniref:Reverse transcriptase domain-containing protein n=1 Tax=Fasciola hepatica TaxID=6192 RepID=A0ABC9HF90_FASHE|nr:unnamed protein product [Fasciola hepatica]